MNAIGIARPELFGLLLLVPLLAALVVLSARARDLALRVFAGGSRLSAQSRMRLWIKSGLLLLAFTSVGIALAGPYVDLRTRGARRLGVDLVVAIDVSQSMATRDVAPDRLRAARHVAQELGDEMVGSRVSLVLFAGQGTVRYPATTDPRIIGEVLDSSGRGVHLQQGSSLAAAVDSAIGAFPTDAEPGRGRAIVVVSDGEVTLGSAPDTARLADSGIRLYAIGVGTPEGGPIPTYDATNGTFTGYLRAADGTAVTSRLDEAGLRKIVANGGQYWRYTGDDSVISGLAGDLRSLEAVASVENAGSVPDEKSSWFVALAVAALLIERFLPDRRRMPAPADHAAKRRRPRGRRLLGLAIGSSLIWANACGGDVASQLEAANAKFAAGQYRDALGDYRDLQTMLPDSPELAIDAGNALHMLGDFARALPDYAHAIDVAPVDVRATAQYDRGNTLFRAGRLEDARDAYRESLRLAPDDRDAKFNLELVQRLLDEKGGLQQNGQAGPSGAPGASGQPGQGQGTNGQSGPGSSPQPGQTGAPSTDNVPPPNDRDPGNAAPSDLRQALNAFRQGLTVDDALKVLDALQSQDRGVAQLLEGPRPPSGQDPQY